MKGRYFFSEIHFFWLVAHYLLRSLAVDLEGKFSFYMRMRPYYVIRNWNRIIHLRFLRGIKCFFLVVILPLVQSVSTNIVKMKNIPIKSFLCSVELFLFPIPTYPLLWYTHLKFRDIRPLRRFRVTKDSERNLPLRS